MRFWVQMMSHANMSCLHFCEGYIYPKVHLQNVIGIYQVVSKILQNQIVMALRILEKNQKKNVIFFLHYTACISFILSENTDHLKQLM